MISSMAASIGAKRLSALPVIGVDEGFFSSSGFFLSAFCERAGRANREAATAAAISSAARPPAVAGGMAGPSGVAGSAGLVLVLAARRRRLLLLLLAAEGLDGEVVQDAEAGAEAQRGAGELGLLPGEEAVGGLL